MLRNIPAILTPPLYDILYSMGHGDRIVIVDANFPASSNAQRLCMMPQLGACETLALLLQFIKVDTFIQNPVTYMEVVPDDPYTPDIWQDFSRIFAEGSDVPVNPAFLSREAFYSATKDAYAVIATGERRRYANIILTKGIIEYGLMG